MIDRDPVYDDEILLHKGKNTKKSPKKANHKHIYNDCLCSVPDKTYDRAKGWVTERKLMFSTYCPICGKLNIPQLWFTDSKWEEKVYELPHAFRFRYTEQAERELDPKTRSIPVFELNDFWQKFVEIDDGKTN